MRNQGSVRSFAARWLGAAVLNARVYAEVESDPGALRQALLVVVAGGLGRGIGVLPEEGWVGFVGSPAVALVVWLVATVVVWAIGVELLGYSSSLPELLRTLGFAAAPLVALALCSLLPRAASVAAWVVVHLWATCAFGVAVREALDVSPVRALAVCAAALGIAVALLFLSAAVLFDTAFLD